jgi:hypothetical protein
MMKDSDYIRHLKIIEQMANNAGKNVRTEIRNPKNKYVYDARVSTFFLIAQVVRWFKISLILKEECLNDPHWYKTRYLLKREQQQPEVGYVPFKGERGRGLVMPEFHDYHSILIREFDQVTLVAYSQVLFSIMESKFRPFLKTAYPDALKSRKKRDTFHNVSECLLEETEKTRYKHLIWFFSLIRNTIHDNGKYWNEKIPCVCTKYKGTIFKFEHDKMVKLPGGAPKWLLLYITPNIIDMMEDIILNSKLKEISFIPEPAAQP